jgi:hypothetical protein
LALGYIALMGLIGTFIGRAIRHGEIKGRDYDVDEDKEKK